MPAFRIVYSRGDSVTPESITASFNDLDQAFSVFAARGLKILYIAEHTPDRVTSRRPIAKLVEGTRRENAPGRANSFPLRRYSGRIMA
jgi:hypothetical protein